MARDIKLCFVFTYFYILWCLYDYMDDTCGRSAPMLQSGGSTVTKSSVQLRHRVGKGILGMEECEKEKNGMGKHKALNIHTKIVSNESGKQYISRVLRARRGRRV